MDTNRSIEIQIHINMNRQITRTDVNVKVDEIAAMNIVFTAPMGKKHMYAHGEKSKSKKHMYT